MVTSDLQTVCVCVSAGGKSEADGVGGRRRRKKKKKKHGEGGKESVGGERRRTNQINWGGGEAEGAE